MENAYSDTDIVALENSESENEELVKLVLEGDKDAYETIVQKYRDIVFGTVCSIVKNHHTAEDITQEVFFEGYLKINTLINAKKVGVWLIKIAKNKCYNYMSRSATSKRETELDEFILDTQYNAELATPENQFIDKYDRYVIEQIIKKLPDTHRNTTVMFYFKKYSRKKIAEVLNIPEGTVKRRLHDARAKLKREFELMASDENYTPSAEFEKNIIRSINNISMINIFKGTEEVKFGEIDNFIGTRIEMTAPTDGEIKDIAKATGVDRTVLEAALYDEEIKNSDKNMPIVQLVTDPEKKENKVGLILKGQTFITVSQNEQSSDDVFKQVVQDIYNLVHVAGYINIDMADVHHVMNIGSKYAHVYVGHIKFEDADEEIDKIKAVVGTIKEYFKGAIIKLTVGPSINLDNINSMMSSLQSELFPNADIIFGVRFDETLSDGELKLSTVIMLP